MTTDVIAVMGSCAPERRQYARRLARATVRQLLPSSRLAMAPDPVGEAASLLPWVDNPAGAVVELPLAVDATHVIGTLADPEAGSRLSAVVCVVDTAHLLADLRRDGWVTCRRGPLDDLETERTSVALLTVAHIEYASTVVLAGWEAVETDELSTVMALVSHLAPRARLRLEHDGLADPGQDDGQPYDVRQDRPGWVCVLNDDVGPHLTDPRVSAVRYEQVRPLHPGRLMAFLRRMETGAFGTVVRSAGFCRLATRAQVVARWEHAGSTIGLEPLVADDSLAGGDELLAVGQDLAFLGLDLDRPALLRALDDTALTDTELAAGPWAWAMLDDPFPAWATARDGAE